MFFQKKTIISVEARGIIKFHFIKRILSIFYKLIFDEELPRVLEEMKSNLQLSPKTRTWDWFLYKEHTVIRVYGFSKAPYLVLSFLNPRLLSLEFIKKRLYSEIEHFLNHKKVSNSKFSLMWDLLWLKPNQLCNS